MLRFRDEKTNLWNRDKYLIFVNLQAKGLNCKIMSKESEFYDKLKLSLTETTTFPTNYMFKFIIPTDKDKSNQIDNMFNKLGAVINSKSSKNKKFTSLTILVDMNSADEIIDKYKEVGTVEGVISL